MKKYIIKIWENEVLRDLGESDIIEVGIESTKEAIEKAKKIMEEQHYASLEVQDEKESETFYFCTPREEEYFYNFQEENDEERIKTVVDLYFAEKGIKNLMDYGSDRDSLAMPTLSDLYKELMDKLNIKYYSVATDDISDGKYESIVELENGNSLVIDTSSWNNEEIVSNNLVSIQQEYEKIKEISQDDIEL